MNKKVLYGVVAIIILIVTIISMAKHIGYLKNENRRLYNNQTALLDSMQTYKVADSLNASKVNMLELSLSDYKRFRAEDAELIKKLKAGQLSSSTSMSSTTKTEIKTLVKDSIIYRDKYIPIDTVKQINYKSYWVDVYGYISNDSACLNVTNREELLIAESLVKKKFLFFKLPVKIFGYKTKSVDAVSKNPNTRINKLEFIQIYK